MRQSSENDLRVRNIKKGLYISTAAFCLLMPVVTLLKSEPWVLTSLTLIALSNLGLGQLAVLVEYEKARRATSERR